MENVIVYWNVNTIICINNNMRELKIIKITRYHPNNLFKTFINSKCNIVVITNKVSYESATEKQP